MAVRDFRGAFDDPALLPLERLIAFGTRAVTAYDIDPTTFTASLIAPYDGVVIDDEEESDPPPTPTCAPTVMTWFMLGGAAPTIECVTPEGEIDVNDPVVVRVLDEDLDRIFITVQYSTGSPEVIFDGIVDDGGDLVGSFSAFYSGSSFAVVSGGFEFTLVNDDSWPSDFTVKTRAWDKLGNPVTEHECAYTVTGLPELGELAVDLCGIPSSVDIGAPSYSLESFDVETCLEISIVSPPTDEVMATNSWVVVDVVDPSFPGVLGPDVRRVLIFANFADGTADEVWDGSTFDAEYLGSYRTAFLGGWRYFIRPASAEWASPLVNLHVEREV